MPTVKELALLVFATTPLGASAFSLAPATSLSVGVRNAAHRSPLFREQSVTRHAMPPFVASPLLGEKPNGSNEAVLREIESKIEVYSKRKEKALDTLNEAEARIQTLENKKKEYIAGAQLADSPEGGNFSETTLRSAVKAFMWRVIAGSVTFITSLRFSGSMSTALSIVGSDFFSKAFTMFIGERLMNKSSAGRKAGGDAVGRSLAKALIWRLFAICNTLTMAVFIAKDLSIASKIAGSDAIFKTALMFFYERVWAKVPWGKEYLIEFSI